MPEKRMILTEDIRKLAAENFDRSLSHDKLVSDLSRDVASRYSAMWLGVERLRHTRVKDEDTAYESWANNKKKGRAFNHYMYFCYDQKVKPTGSGFCKVIGDASLKTAFSRMFADWQANGWCDENGRPSEYRLQYNMNRVLDVIDAPNMRNFLVSAIAFRSLYLSNSFFESNIFGDDSE